MEGLSLKSNHRLSLSSNQHVSQRRDHSLLEQLGKKNWQFIQRIGISMLDLQNRLASTIPCVYQGCKERHSCSGMSLHLSWCHIPTKIFYKIIIIHFYQNFVFGSNLPLLTAFQCFPALTNVPCHFPNATQ